MKSSFHACPQGGTFAVYCLISVFLCLIALPGSFAEPLCESYSTNSCPSPRCMVWDDMCLETALGDTTTLGTAIQLTTAHMTGSIVSMRAMNDTGESL